MHPTAKQLYIEQLQECQSELANLCERVTEIIENKQCNNNDALAVAFTQTISDAQSVLRLIIKLAKRSQFYDKKPTIKFGEQPCQP